MKEIAVYGGTFDPPTIVHEAIIRACLARPDMDEVWVMPSGLREDKLGMQPDETRLAMLALMKHYVFNDDVRLVLSAFELGLPRPTQTYQTVEALACAYPDNHFNYVFGADSYEAMETWEHGLRLKRTIGMLLVSRIGYELPAATPRIRHLEISESDKGISSTRVREAVWRGIPLDGMVSDGVAGYIRQNRLYEHVTIDG